MNRFRFIQVESAKGVQTITLNRPEKRNALTPELIDELIQVLDEVVPTLAVRASPLLLDVTVAVGQ